MKRFSTLVVVVVIVLWASLDSAAQRVSNGVADEEWPQFRGQDAIPVSANPNLPSRWSTDENVEWATDIPGTVKLVTVTIFHHGADSRARTITDKPARAETTRSAVRVYPRSITGAMWFEMAKPTTIPGTSTRAERISWRPKRPKNASVVREMSNPTTKNPARVPRMRGPLSSR